MEVIHFNTQKHWRGGERQLAWQMEELHKRGVKQLLLCRKKSKLEAFAINQNIEHQSFTITFYNLIYIAFKIAKLIKNKPVILHCHDSKSHTIGLIIKLIFIKNYKLIIDRKVLFPITGWFSKKIKYASKHVDLTICVSKAVEETIFLTTKNNKTTVIGDMIFENTSEYKNLLQTKYGITQKYIIGYIAAMTFEKDHNTFLKTAKELLKFNPEIGFVLVGDGKLMTEIKAQVKELEIESNVHFLGFISNVPEIIQEIDLLLFTSKSEGLGSTILDFFMAKKPVVTVKNGGSESLVFNNQTGIICSKFNFKNLAISCLKFYTDPVFTKQITDNAYQFAINNFTPEMITTKLIEEYQKVLKS